MGLKSVYFIGNIPISYPQKFNAQTFCEFKKRASL